MLFPILSHKTAPKQRPLLIMFTAHCDHYPKKFLSNQNPDQNKTQKTDKMQFSRLPAPVARKIDMFSEWMGYPDTDTVPSSLRPQLKWTAWNGSGKICTLPFTNQPYFESCSICAFGMRNDNRTPGVVGISFEFGSAWSRGLKYEGYTKMKCWLSSWNT